MCSVSAIYDYGKENPPWQVPAAPFPNFFPPPPHLPLPDQDAVTAIKKFLALIEAAKEFDAATGQPNCEDPKKAEFMKEVLERLAAIEARLGL